MERIPDADLQHLMERLADGDRSAFHPVFESLWPLLRRFAARHLPTGEVDDVAQEALLRVFHRASEWDPRRSALAWVLGIAAFEIRTARRRRQRRREAAASSDVIEARPDPAPTPEDVAMQSDMETLVRDVLGTLRPEDAETLRLYSRGERAHVAAATFRKRVERAIGRLRSAWRTTDERF